MDEEPPGTKALAITILAALLISPIGACAATAPAVLAPGREGAPVTVVRFPLSRYRLGVALAGSRVGANDFLLNIARTAAAQCAMNGSFFASYAGETGEPYGTLVVDGKLVHLGTIGTRLDVLANGKVQIVRDGLEIRGRLNGSDAYPYNWYAYNLNQTPSPGGSSVYIYTPERGATLGFRAELAVVARGGWVTAISRGHDVAIPGDGFVIAMQRKEVEVLGWKFAVGQRIDYRAVQDGVPFESRFSLGTGPRLIQRGAISVSPIAEGFRDPKIVTMRGRRAAVGLTGANEVILAIVDHATMTGAAVVMIDLGAVEAMNLDDNASSGLVCNGRYLVQPARQVANALVLWAGS
jgi:hypothetical protein